MALYGLIGFPLGHSFSARFFNEKFKQEGRLADEYRLFPMADLGGFSDFIGAHPDLRGLNVTIPHKQTVMPFLDRLDPVAAAVGAVNTLHIRDGVLTGFNTDVEGFEKSLDFWLAPPFPVCAAVMGSGGASRAVVHALQHRVPTCRVVSRKPSEPNQIAYGEAAAWRHNQPGPCLWVNATPVGTFPDIHVQPPLPAGAIRGEDLVYDLVYNPSETLLLQRARLLGCRTKNGLDMLYRQAEAAWYHWQSTDKPDAQP